MFWYTHMYSKFLDRRDWQRPLVAASFVHHLFSGNCLVVRLAWEFKVALRGDAHSFGTEGAGARSLGVSVEEAALLVDSWGFQERKWYLRLSQPL